jgi:hypothetical protein
MTSSKADNKIVISRVCAEDRSLILEFSRAAHAETIFKEIPFSERKFDKFFQEALNNTDYYLGIKATLGANILGILYCYRGGYFVGEGAKVASVNVINVNEDIRSTILGGKVALRLVRELESWARSKGVDVILFYVTSGETISKTDRFFRKMGMTTLGGNYGIRLKY